jgi:hypothetical protein
MRLMHEQSDLDRQICFGGVWHVGDLAGSESEDKCRILYDLRSSLKIEKQTNSIVLFNLRLSASSQNQDTDSVTSDYRKWEDTRVGKSGTADGNEY